MIALAMAWPPVAGIRIAKLRAKSFLRQLVSEF